MLREHPGVNYPIVIGDNGANSWLMRECVQTFDCQSGIGIEQLPESRPGIKAKSLIGQFWQR
jgi:hypothetical protein